MISIVIPCFNAEATLEETVRSALAQDVDSEIIVVDDGSTDGSPGIISSLGDRIRSVRTANRGVSAARTTGGQLARGSFVQYLDSDDLLVPGTLANRCAALNASGADVAYTDWQKIVPQVAGGYAYGDIMVPDNEALACDAEVATATSVFWAPPAALLYRRAVVDRIGEWSPRLPVIQDARFLFDAAVSGARFVHVPGVGAYYRVVPGSLSRRSTARFIADCVVNTSEIEELWRARGLMRVRQREALAAMWWHVAHAALVEGLEPFENARARYNDVGPRRVRFEAGMALRWMIGPRRTAVTLRWLRRAYRAAGKPRMDRHNQA